MPTSELPTVGNLRVGISEIHHSFLPLCDPAQMYRKWWSGFIIAIWFNSNFKLGSCLNHFKKCETRLKNDKAHWPLSALSLFFFSSTYVRVCSAISVLSGERCIHEVWREHVASLVGKWVALPSLLLAHHRYFSPTADAAAVDPCRIWAETKTQVETQAGDCA